jgi:hypothetical protein
MKALSLINIRFYGATNGIISFDIEQLCSSLNCYTPAFSKRNEIYRVNIS